MLFNTQTLALTALIATIANARPLDASRPRDIVARSKSYAIINVDGGTSTGGSPTVTRVVKETKTVEVVNPEPTATQEVTAIVVQPAPVSTPTRSSSVSVGPSSPVETAKPILITVTVSADSGPTEYYDDGMWHTRYRIKSFEPAVPTWTFSTWTTSCLDAPSSTVLPA